jgi:hypothetical protein
MFGLSSILVIALITSVTKVTGTTTLGGTHIAVDSFDVTP